jgi:phenylacetate-CoA ligase
LNILTNLSNRAWGSAVIASHIFGQRKTACLPRKQLDELRDRRVRDIVAYAAKHVPFYPDWFTHLGVRPGDIRGAADLDRLPLIDRDLVRTQPRLFLSKARAARNALSFQTSGTTGTPVQIWHDRASLLANIPYGERERVPVNETCGSFRPKEVYVGYESSTFKKVIAFYNESTFMPVRPKRRFVSLLEPLESIAGIINQERPDVLVGYGGWIDLFFKSVSAQGIKLHPPKLVMYMGEALPYGAREFIEQEFGIPVFSRYNAVESFKIGFYCQQRSGFHLHEDLCHIRIAGPDGAAMPAGASGQVVLSNLVNRGTVLLNYPMGDVAALQDIPCSCGRTFRTLSELDGRLEDILQLGGGRCVHPRAIWEVVKRHPEVLQYQLIQREMNRFDLALVTRDEPAFSAVLEPVLAGLKRLLGEDATINATRRPGLHKPEGGKVRVVVSLGNSGAA